MAEKKYGNRESGGSKKSSRSVASFQNKKNKISSEGKVDPSKRFDFQEKAFHAEKKIESQPTGPIILKPMTLSSFSDLAGLSCSDIIISKLKEGKMYAKNYLLSEKELKDLCEHYGIETELPVVRREEFLHKGSVVQQGTVRAPVVVVMGHVDHGKTSLLDFIRKTRVAAKEKGGITQHLGAYEVPLAQGTLVFLDTPGHEAFSKIRKRGACVADIAILVVAADDGVMPQTVESIKAIKALNVLPIVAINKMDKVDSSRLEIIYRQLSQYDLVPEAWGGTVTCVPISAKTGQGVDKLLELIALHAEMMELASPLDVLASGYILESRMLQGRGVVATVLCHRGILHVGNLFNAGGSIGKVTSLVDSLGKDLKSVGPSIPVLVTGFTDMPEVGATFEVVTEEESKKIKIATTHVSLQNNARNQLFESGDVVLNVIVKADTHSSLEAIIDGIHKLNQKVDLKKIVVLRSGIGDVSEGDILFSQDTGATIIGFNIKTEHNASVFLKKSDLKIYTYNIIYMLFDDLQKKAAKIAEVKKVLTKIGQALILKVFDIKKLGIVAGGVVKEGRFSEKGKVIALRGRKSVGEGMIKSLQRDKKAVKEVHTGFEFAFMITGFDEWQEGDIAECYLEMPV